MTCLHDTAPYQFDSARMIQLIVNKVSYPSHHQFVLIGEFD